MLQKVSIFILLYFFTKIGPFYNFSKQQLEVYCRTCILSLPAGGGGVGAFGGSSTATASAGAANVKNK